MATLLASTPCTCARPMPLRQRSISRFSASVPSLHNPRSSPAAAPGVCRMKPEIHPEYYEDAKVYCNGEEVMTTSGTKQSYTVDIWSGNHPFFKGSASSVVVDEGRVNRFKRRYAGLENLADMSAMSSGGEAVDLKAWKKSQQKGKPQKGKGKK